MEPKILIADDSAFMRRMLRNILEAKGYRDISDVPDGISAVETYKKERPDILLLDIIMHGKDGIAVLGEVLGFDKEAKIVIVSAIGQEAKIKQAMEMGAKAYVVKPFDEGDIIDIVKKLLE